MRINVGCGAAPTPGWVNLDCSPSVRLARRPVLSRVLRAVGVVNAEQWRYIEFCRSNAVQFGNACRLPLRDASAEVVYTSHMLEHLDPRDAAMFLEEARRVLRPGGVLRLAVPDLAALVEAYTRSPDADVFMAESQLAMPRPRSLREWLFAGFSGSLHRWLYDVASLERLVARVGFHDPRAVAPGETRIIDPAPLDLHERAEQSIYVEATR